MSETFFCEGKELYMTNGGAWELFKGWSRCAENSGYDKLSELLYERMQMGFGFSADGIDEEYLSEELNVPELKIQWLSVMQEFMREVSDTGDVAKSLDINWDEDLKAYWLSKLTIMHKALNVQVNV